MGVSRPGSRRPWSVRATLTGLLGAFLFVTTAAMACEVRCVLPDRIVGGAEADLAAYANETSHHSDGQLGHAVGCLHAPPLAAGRRIAAMNSEAQPGQPSTVRGDRFASLVWPPPKPRPRGLFD